MEVHHHSHTDRKKWKHYFWEFLMLFLAVSLGFLVENFREHYVERHRVKQYAFSLRNDLERDTGMINIVMGRIQLNIRLTDSLSAYLAGKDVPGVNNLTLFVLSSIDRYPPYTWNRATIEQMKNSGSLRYFTNQDIVRAISEYDAFTRHMDEDQKADDGMANRASELRAQVVDMDYSAAFNMGLRNNIDSVLLTADYLALRSSDPKKVLARDIRHIRTYLNEKINIRKHLMVRMNEELPRLKIKARDLILMLNKEFHF
jgi:hypothetical protein